MKKRLVLKPFVLPTLYILMVVTLMFMSTTMIYEKDDDEDITYVSDSIFNNTLPVISSDEVFVLNPFSSDKVKITTGFYNYQEEESKQESSIVKYDNTYLQNSGITYSSDEKFDIVSIMDGKVTKIYNNELLGNIVEITHENNIVSIYQMLTDVVVKVDSRVKRGDIIAKSGPSKLLNTTNNLHFEIIKDGMIINPSTILGKNIKDI
ncbi:MAG: M23 family metallopeptidase [Bacilli bacterium]|nr:M23 family metallopeptidase [Bacilli bacterium]